MNKTAEGLALLEPGIPWAKADKDAIEASFSAWVDTWLCRLWSGLVMSAAGAGGGNGTAVIQDHAQGRDARVRKVACSVYNYRCNAQGTRRRGG